MYEVGMLCKHFKGTNLLEKNIYQIIETGILGQNLPSGVVYTGDGDLSSATDLVIYANVFQEDKFFAREYSALTEELPEDKKAESGQSMRVEPLTIEEIILVTSQKFIDDKKAYMESKLAM